MFIFADLLDFYSLPGRRLLIKNRRERRERSEKCGLGGFPHEQLFKTEERGKER